MIGLLALLKNPFARWLGVGLATLGVLFLIYNAGRTAGIKAEARRTAPIISKLQTDLATARANTATLQSAVDQQNDAVQALKAASDAKVAEAEAALRIASAKRAGAEARAAALLHTPLPGATEVERMRQADELVLRGLQ